jgi:hypothetical protein
MRHPQYVNSFFRFLQIPLHKKFHAEANSKECHGIADTLPEQLCLCRREVPLGLQIDGDLVLYCSPPFRFAPRLRPL